MKKFNFRLEKVLEFRAMVEESAKEAYLDARTARLEAEVALHGIDARRKELLNMPIKVLDDRQVVEARLHKLDDQEHEQKTVIRVLLSEEERAMEDWKERRLEVQVLEKLKEKALAEWELEAGRLEQSELDEWTVTRRAA